MLAVRRWRSSQLLLAWIAYWIALVVVTLGRAIVAGWRATQAPQGHGSIDAGVTNNVVHLKVVQDAITTWSGTASLGTIALWLVVPPLLLWLVWLASRPRVNVAPAALGEAPRASLGAVPDERWPAREQRTPDAVRAKRRRDPEG